MRGLMLLAIPLTLLGSTGQASDQDDPRFELDQVVCEHWTDPKDDPTLGVRFKYNGDDFANVNVTESFVSRYIHDPLHVTIAEKSAQVATSDQRYSIDDLEGFSVVIERPIPQGASSKTTTATLTFDNGEQVDLRCWKE